MRINSALTSVKKVFWFVKNLTSQDTKFYQTTKDQLCEIRELCDQVSDMISDIVDESETSAPSEEFAPRCSEDYSFLLQKLSDMEKQIQAMAASKEIPVSEVRPAIRKNKTASCVTPIKCTKSDKPTVRKQKISSGTEITKSYCGDATYRFGLVLRKMASVSYRSPHINRLTHLLYDWYEARITKNKAYNCGFKYSIRRIRRLVGAIIIGYGYHMECGDTEHFVKSFYDWLRLLGDDTTVTNQYATPYEIYDIEINKNPAFANNTAEVLYDLLYELGLSELAVSKPFMLRGVGFTHDLVSSTIRTMNPDVYECYRDYRVDPSVLDDCGLSEMREGVDLVAK